MRKIVISKGFASVEGFFFGIKEGYSSFTFCIAVCLLDTCITGVVPHVIAICCLVVFVISSRYRRSYFKSKTLKF